MRGLGFFAVQLSVGLLLAGTLGAAQRSKRVDVSPAPPKTTPTGVCPGSFEANPLDYPRPCVDPSRTAFSVLNYGARGDYLTDDTKAVQAAIDAMITGYGAGVVDFPPTASAGYILDGKLNLPVPPGGWGVLRVRSRIRVGSTIVLPHRWAIIGEVGKGSGMMPQFLATPTELITPRDATVNPVIQIGDGMSPAAANVLKGINIAYCDGDCISIVGKGGGPIKIEGVAAFTSSISSGSPLKIRDAIWIHIDGCAFHAHGNSPGGHAIDSGGTGGVTTPAGQVYISNTVFSHRGLKIGLDTHTMGPGLGQYVLRNVSLENAQESLVIVDTTNTGMGFLSIYDSTVADIALNGPTILSWSGAYPLQYVTIVNTPPTPYGDLTIAPGSGTNRLGLLDGTNWINGVQRNK